MINAEAWEAERHSNRDAEKEFNVGLLEESSKPVYVAVETTDLTAELKPGPSYVRNENNPKAQSSVYGNGQVTEPCFYRCWFNE